MRKILLVLCILSITICAKAQFPKKGPFPLVSSMNYYNWAKGAYYDSTGTKHTGFINWEIPMSSFINNKITYIGFKPTKKADDVKVYATGLRSFVVDEDSIVVTGNELFKKSPFLKVLINNKDTTKLYEYLVAKRSGSATMGMGISAQFSYTTSTYYYGSNSDNLIKLDKKNFNEVMPRLMADKPEAVARIKNKKLRYGNMTDLLYFYKYDVMPPAAAPDPFSGLDH